MVTTNITGRVFRIIHNGKTATAYTVEKGENQYLISASHVFNGSLSINEVTIYYDGKWMKIPVHVVFNALEGDGDTIVFKLAFDISPRYEVEYFSKSVLFGTWAYFLGFPFGMSTPAGEINNKFPLPFIKAGLVSSMNGERDGLTTIFLDGHNNKGFSGGPVVWYHPNEPKKTIIIGTISGYLTESPIHTETLDDINSQGTNAGIIEAFWIRNLFEYI